MRALCTLLGTAALLLTATPALAEVNLAGNGQTGVYTCKGGSATVTGNQNKITLRNCTSVSVMGNQNTVHAGVVKTIKVMGNKNTVTYKLGPKGQKPSVSNLGNGNKVHKQ